MHWPTGWATTNPSGATQIIIATTVTSAAITTIIIIVIIEIRIANEQRKH